MHTLLSRRCRCQSTAQPAICACLRSPPPASVNGRAGLPRPVASKEAARRRTEWQRGGGEQTGRCLKCLVSHTQWHRVVDAPSPMLAVPTAAMCRLAAAVQQPHEDLQARVRTQPCDQHLILFACAIAHPMCDAMQQNLKKHPDACSCRCLRRGDQPLQAAPLAASAGRPRARGTGRPASHAGSGAGMGHGHAMLHLVQGTATGSNGGCNSRNAYGKVHLAPPARLAHVAAQPSRPPGAAGPGCPRQAAAASQQVACNGNGAGRLHQMTCDAAAGWYPTLGAGRQARPPSPPLAAPHAPPAAAARW